MFHLVFCIILTLFSSAMSMMEECLRQFDNSVYKPHPDMYLRTSQVISKYGYPVEKHTVVTDDGYILTLYRIPSKGNTNGTTQEEDTKYPVYLNHGLFANGHIWLIQHGPRNLAFKLASEGFDVWLANARGTRYSQLHTKLTPDAKRYWSFSFHEMGIYDVPAIIHYIRRVTLFPKIYYIGHSMGSTELFVALSEIPELNKFIATAIFYAPVAFLSNTESLAKNFAPIGEELYVLTHPEFQGRFNGINFFEKQLGQKLGEMCSYMNLACGLCSEINAHLFGRDPLQMNYTLQSLFFSHVPDTVSTKTVLHFLQLINSGNFRQFDYGSASENKKRYGPDGFQPPDYNLSKITAPMVLFWSDNDNLATPKDVHKTISHLRPDAVKESIRVGWYMWTHRDYIKGIDADKLVYEPTIHILKNKLYG